MTAIYRSFPPVLARTWHGSGHPGADASSRLPRCEIGGTPSSDDAYGEPFRLVLSYLGSIVLQ